MSSNSEKNDFQALVHKEWESTQTVNAWRKWHTKMIPHLAPMTEILIAGANIKPGDRVLDLASGSGEPALTIAKRIAPTGQIIATDLSSGLLSIAEENAQQVQISNIQFQTADVHELPFENQYFDVVTSRLGIMYFWDCQKALSEIQRVLKPNGTLSLIAWGAIEKNGLARTLITPFAKRKALPIVPPDMPQPFRFTKPGSLSAELKQAAFKNIQEHTKVIPCPWPGPPEEFWHHLYEVVSPLQPFFDSFASNERQAAINEVILGFGEFFDGQVTDPKTCIVAATAMC
jgi:ubiquinone/menaquinone biosynthesis C-methylase UbiE